MLSVQLATAPTKRLLQQSEIRAAGFVEHHSLAVAAGDPDAADCPEVRADGDLDAENNLLGLLRNFGLKVGTVTRVQFERRIVELLEQSPHIWLIIEPLLEVRRVLREQFEHLNKGMGRLAESDETWSC